MATDQRVIDPAESPEVGGIDPASHPSDWYDRSTLHDGTVVVIPDQAEEKFLRMWPDRAFCEFIDGTVYLHAASNPHQLHVQFLLVLIGMFDAVRDIGVVLSGPAILRPRDGAYFEPDIFVMPRGFVRDPGNLSISPPPLLVIEVLSPSNRKIDPDIKASIYREADTAEVWFLDARDRVVLVDRRAGEGRESIRVDSGALRSTGLPGFRIDVNWLWAEPRPNLIRCSEQILAGPPA